MKKSTLILFVSFSILSYSQKYVPFPTENAEWNVAYSTGPNYPYGISTMLLQYSLHGDTIINDIGYKKICLNVGTLELPVYRPVGGLREMNKQIFYVGSGYINSVYWVNPQKMKWIKECSSAQLNNNELLLYDFNVKKGDTIQWGYYGDIIDKIDSVLIGQSYRKRYSFKNSNNLIIEGIGSVVKGLFDKTTPILACGGGSNMDSEHICFSQNDQTVYHNPAFVDCNSTQKWNKKSFSTKLYLENVKGEKDSLEIGYDSLATKGLDVSFGEIGIPSPIDKTKFQAFFLSSDQGVPIFSKKQIVNNYTGWVEQGAIPIVFPYESLPVTISWDKSLFTNGDRDYSIITDWFLGGWFDATAGWSAKLEQLKWYDSIQFTAGNTTAELLAMKQHGYVYWDNGTEIPMRTIYLAFADQRNFWTGIKEIETNNVLQIYPNPTSDKITINSKLLSTPCTFELMDLHGVVVLRSNMDATNNTVEIKSYNEGMYLYRLLSNGKIITTGKLIKI